MEWWWQKKEKETIPPVEIEATPEEKKPLKRLSVMEITAINTETDKEYIFKAENNLGLKWKYIDNLLTIRQPDSLDNNLWHAIAHLQGFSMIKIKSITFYEPDLKRWILEEETEKKDSATHPHLVSNDLSRMLIREARKKGFNNGVSYISPFSKNEYKVKGSLFVRKIFIAGRGTGDDAILQYAINHNGDGCVGIYKNDTYEWAEIIKQK